MCWGSKWRIVGATSAGEGAPAIGPRPAVASGVAELHLVADTATSLTYGVAVAALVGELLVLRVLGEHVDHRGGRASLLSGLLAFGGLAIAQRLVFAGLLLVAWEHRVLDLGPGAGAWVVAFVAYDLMFYVAHRLGHELRILWCFHSVHHTSTEMRLVSAIRGSAFDAVYLPWFFVWLPLLGIHPAMVIAVEATGRVWGVLTHVHHRFVGRLGIFDRILVTPAVHRVHHGRDLAYLDSNYGEVLTLWDHVAGTYVPLAQEPEYGVLKELDDGDLREIQLSPWADLWSDLRRAPDLWSRLRYLFDAPGWSHDGPDRRAKSLRGS